MADRRAPSAERVYTSDASWSASGNRSGRRYHFEKASDRALAACGRFLLDNVGQFGDDAYGQDPLTVPDFMRCRRPACALRYLAAKRPCEQVGK